MFCQCGQVIDLSFISVVLDFPELSMSDGTISCVTKLCTYSDIVVSSGCSQSTFWTLFKGSRIDWCVFFVPSYEEGVGPHFGSIAVSRPDRTGWQNVWWSSDQEKRVVFESNRLMAEAMERLCGEKKLWSMFELINLADRQYCQYDHE